MSEQQDSSRIDPNRFAIPLEQLVDEARVSLEDQVEGQAAPPAPSEYWDEARRQAELAGGA